MAQGKGGKRLEKPGSGGLQPTFKKVVAILVINDISLDREILRDLIEEKSSDPPPAVPVPSSPLPGNIATWEHRLADRKMTPGATDPGEFDYFLRAPRGSIIGKAITGAEPGDKSLELYLPFFSSHFCMPVKPGERVWTFELGKDKYWLTRIHEQLHVEDLNYTHGDRLGLPTVITDIPGEADHEMEFNREPGFPNGAELGNRDIDNPEYKELDVDKIKDKDEGIDFNRMILSPFDAYELIVDGNPEKDRIVYEAVPRYTKRPGDLVIQGSNNTLISLGTERGIGSGSPRPIDQSRTNADPTADLQPPDVPPSGPPPHPEFGPSMGAIDVVAGRGRMGGPHFPIDQIDSEPDGNDPAETRARIIKNRRSHYETDKNVGLEDTGDKIGLGKVDIPEGDPDMIHDASRVYLSMKSNPDALLGLTYPDVPSATPNAEEPNKPEPVALSTDSATVIIKSDEIRIVARQNIVDGEGINGSIKIVKEGTPDAEDGTARAVIMIQPDGTIMIDGPKIVLGSGMEKTQPDVGEGGEGEQVVIGNGATEPLLLGDVLLKKIQALEKKYNDHFHPGGTGPTDTPTVKSEEAWKEAKSKVARTK